MTAASQSRRLRLVNFSKHFGQTRALDEVNLTIAPGEIHGLVGQNGSGKSTLVKLMSGYHRPERGSRMEVDGVAVSMPPRPKDLLAAGISFVHQDLGLLDHLSVSENICVGNSPTSRILRRIDTKRQNQVCTELLQRLGVAIPPSAPVHALTPAQRAVVAIARSLFRQTRGSGIVLLDEATRALPAESRGDIHRVIRRIAADGGSVLMISHDLDEIVEVAHRITVLRDGRVVGGSESDDQLDAEALARAMLGFNLAKTRVARRADVTGQPVRARAIRGGGVRSFDVDIEPGEVVGLTGLPGSGWEDLPYVLAGAWKGAGGTLALGDVQHDLGKASVRQLRRCGVALVPERRDRDGLAMEMSIADNITVPRLRDRGSWYFAGNAWRHAEAADVIRRLGVRPANPQLLVRQLSGGNQQKVVIGKWLAGAPKLLVLHEPTQGVDVGARVDILDALSAAAASGIAVLIASLEAADLAAVCDRVLIFADGQVARSMATDQRDEIIGAIYAASRTAAVR